MIMSMQWSPFAEQLEMGNVVANSQSSWLEVSDSLWPVVSLVDSGKFDVFH